MQINKPNKKRNSRPISQSEKGSAHRASLKRSHYRRPDEQPKEVIKPTVSKEDALIDLYDDPFKNTNSDEPLIINIDFSKPTEILGKIYRQILELLRVAQSKLTKENANRFWTFVRRDRKTTIISGITAAVILLALGYSIFGSKENSQIAQVQGESTKEEPQIGVKPEYDLLYPTNRTEEELPVALISPPGAPLAYTYADTVNGVEVRITQQEVPQNLKNNQEEEFRTFAINSAFNTEIKDDEYTAYLGVSEEGPQSVIMIKKELLVLLKSTKTLPIEVWSEYLATFN